MARRRFFVDEIRNGQARITGPEAYHLTRVLRVEPGQKYEISDDSGVFLARIEAARKDLVTFAVLDRVAPEEPPVHIHLFASLIRFERFELLLEKATELGVGSVTPVAADRSEKGLERAAAKRMVRWQRILREASEQARRAHLPKLLDPVSVASAARAQAPIKLLLEETPGTSCILSCLQARRLSSSEPAALAVGPEGGWTDRERALFQQEDWTAVSLGGTVLKTETAVISALAVLNAAYCTIER